MRILTEHTEVPGTGTEVLQNAQKFRVLWHGRTELTEVPGRYKNALPVPRVFMARAYRASRSSGYGYELSYITHRSSGYGYESLTELTEVLCRVILGVNTPGMVLYVPYRT